MNIYDRARLRAKNYSQQEEITLRTGAVETVVKCMFTDHSLKFDESGNVVNGRNATLLIHEDTLTDAGITSHIIGYYADVRGRKYQITQKLPSKTIGSNSYILRDAV